MLYEILLFLSHTQPPKKKKKGGGKKGKGKGKDKAKAATVIDGLSTEDMTKEQVSDGGGDSVYHSVWLSVCLSVRFSWRSIVYV